MTELTLTRPDDWHVHLRDGAALQRDLRATWRATFGRAIVMPNLSRRRSPRVAGGDRPTASACSRAMAEQARASSSR